MFRRFLLVVAIVLFVAIGGCEENRRYNSRKPAVQVVAFSASWCGPCQRAKPILIQIQAAGVGVRIVDIDAQPDVARRFGVTSVPTFFVYVDGVMAMRTQGVYAARDCVLRVLLTPRRGGP